MAVSSTTKEHDWRYLAREAGLILIWAYVVLAAGSVTGLVNFRLQVASTILGAAVIGVWLALRILQPSPHALPPPLSRSGRGEGVARSGIEWGILAFLGGQLVATILSDDPRRSLPVLAQYTAYVLIYYLVLDLLQSGWPAELIEKTLLIVGGIVVALALLELWQVYSGWRALVADLPLAPPFRHRLFAVFGEANLLAAFLNLLLPLAIARALATPARMTRVLLGTLALAALVVEYFAFSRGGALGAATALATLAGLWAWVVSAGFRDRALRAWLWLRSHRLALLGALTAVAVALAGFLKRALQFQGDATHSPLLQARSSFWHAAWVGFRSAPVWGLGPGTYPTTLIRAESMPPARPYLHAHSVPFTLAVEAGTVGVVGMLVLIFFVVQTLRRVQHGASISERARWAGAVAALAGLAAHSLFDDHTRFLAVGVPMAVLLAIALWQPQRSPRGFNPLWLALPGVAVVAFSLYSLRAQAHSERGIEAALEGNWTDAAHAFDEAAARDPAFAFYWLESGFAHGRLAADGDLEALTVAIDRLERGVALEPDYALNHANLAALYRQAGRTELARAGMQQASEIAPHAAAFAVNAGLYAEEAGEEPAARRYYEGALEAQSALAASDFWDGTQLRADVLTGWKSGPGGGADTDVALARAALARGDLAAADRDLTAAWQADPLSSGVYLGLGDLSRARGDATAAAAYYELAISVQSQSNAGKVEPLLAWAELAQEQGDVEAAVVRYEQVLDSVTEYTIYGWGTWGWQPYAWFVFQRRGLPVDVLPQLARIDLPADVAARLARLADIYQAAGEPDRAQAVRARLASALP